LSTAASFNSLRLLGEAFRRTAGTDASEKVDEMTKKFWVIGIDAERCAELNHPCTFDLANEQREVHRELGLIFPDTPIYGDYATAEMIANKIWKKTRWPLRIVDNRGKATLLWKIREKGKSGLVT
jgi:hypothetical protein